MKKSLIIAVAGFALTGCGKQLEIQDAEKAGFEKQSPKFASMVGATEGWDGLWKGETVEIYVYGSSSEGKASSVEAMVQGDDFWRDFCRNRNLVMISTGTEACKALLPL